MTKKKQSRKKKVNYSLVIVGVGVLFFGLVWYFVEGGGERLGVGFGGSSVSEEPFREREAEKFRQKTTYYNDYFGLSYTVPRGWWRYDGEEENFATQAKREQTGQLDLLEIRLDGEAEFAELIAVGNEQYSSSGTHLGLDWTVERVAGKKTLSEYMDYYNEYMTDESYSGGVFRLQESGRVEINGRVWERRVYTIDESEPYYVLCLVTEVKNGFFLSVSATYWPENERAEEQVLEHVEKQLQISR